MDRVRRSVPALSFKTRRASGSRKPCEQPAGGPNRRSDESGVALIAVLLIMSLLLMLGLAVTFSSVSDKFVTSNFKNVTSGFYAAEAGIQNLHRMLRSDRFVLASLPEPVVIRTGEPTLNERDFTTAAERALNLKEKFPNNAAYETKIKIKSINVPYPATDDNPSHRSRRVTYINRLYPRLGQIEPYSVSYEVEARGEGIEGLNGSVTLIEEGVVNFKLLVKADGGGLRVGSFAEFALFLDRFNPYNPEGPFIYQGLGPGDRFAGRIHTNERFGFWTPADGSDPPVFRGYVTQSYKTASYYRFNAGTPPPPVDADSAIVGGVLVAPKFMAGFDRGVDPIPATGNAFDQARAVLDGGSALSAGAPTDGELHTNLRAAGDLNTKLPDPKDPESLVPSLKKGVYIPSDGEALTGSGIYVMGDSDDIVLSADPSGNRQTIKITQNGKTTTVVIDIDAGITTIDSGDGARTLKGVPPDREINTSGKRAAASLYVYGDIRGIRGPGRDGNDQPIPAIDSEFAITVTAGGATTGKTEKPVSGGSVTIKGDMTYETPVVDPQGNPINPKANNVLGIYASGGNIEIPSRGLDNLTVHASIAAFELKDDAGSGVLGPNGRPYGGRIRSDLDNWKNTPNKGRFTLVGGAQSTNYDNLGVYDGQFHGYQYKGVWDPRYDQGQSPPFYPGYVVDAGGPTGTPTVKALANSPQILSHKRVYYGADKR